MSKLVEEQKQSERKTKYSVQRLKEERKFSALEGLTIDGLDKSAYPPSYTKYLINQLDCLNHNKWELGEFTS